MPASTAKLKRLRNHGAPDLRERGRYDIIKVTQRLLRLPSGETSDLDSMRANQPAAAGGLAMVATAAVKARAVPASATVALAPKPDQTNRLFPSTAERGELVDIARNRFAAESEALIARAEGAIGARFDLLGHQGLSFGDPIDWRLEPLSGKRTGLEPRTAVDYLDPRIAGDQRITLELNRCGHFVTFGQAYWLTRDERFARAFV